MALTADEPFIRYLVAEPSWSWWDRHAKPFLEARDWAVIDPADFSYPSSYGFDPNRVRTETRDFEYSLATASAVVEYHGEPTDDSIFVPNQSRTLVDDLLAFMSLYTGIYCQYVCKESRDGSGNGSASFARRVANRSHNDEWIAGHARSLSFFEDALATIPTVDREQFELAIRWFFSALRDFEIGRQLVEAALNWVCLEAQANYLGLAGSKYQKVNALLANQGFSTIPRLRDWYKLRNDAVHDGTLSNLSEPDAQAARGAGRALVRAQILKLIGMEHSDFRPEFVAKYAP